MRRRVRLLGVGNLSDLLEAMIKTILVASLWIMIAALIAVYFISEMVIVPLKHDAHAKSLQYRAV